MKKFQICKLSLALGACGLLTVMPASAGKLSFAEAPAGSIVVTPPPPNLILTLDNSTSMRDNKDGGVLSRFDNLKAALVTAFSSTNVPENSIRLGWNTLNNFTLNRKTYSCASFSASANSCGAEGNIVRPLTEAHRNNFISWVNNIFTSSGSTPTHNAYQTALAEYDKPYSQINSPWAESPGTRVGDYLTCRKSYVMLLTDGEYNISQSNGVEFNSSTDLDGVGRVLGDGSTSYPPASVNSANIYKQAQNSSNSYKNTLADLAFHYWAKDADGISGNNNVKALSRITTVQNGIDPFWNPQNDPATWQHVSTYTIGYGKTASGWNSSPKLATGETLFDSADLKRLMLGTLSWPTHTWSGNSLYMEMMHAAINGRGKYYPATTQQELVDAIKDLLTDVIPVPQQQVTSATGSTLSAYADSDAYYTSYDTEQWSGDVTAVTLKSVANGGGVAATSPWTGTAASQLTSTGATARKIFTAQVDLTGATPVWSGHPFNWTDLSADQQTALRGTATVNPTTTTLGTNRLAYLRGDRTKEQKNGGSFRNRASMLGDIVNSDVWFMKGVPNAGYTTGDYLDFVADKKNRTNALFVGANDGMLHAFDADDGSELFAYVPLGAYANLASLTDPGYSHKYFVDGSPFTADYCKTYSGSRCSSWGTMLVGFMGAGGKGYFMIDVTDPAAVAATSVKMDTTNGVLPGNSAADPDIGYIFQKPVREKSNALSSRQIVRMNNDKWALVTGNGYNSTDEKAVLIIQYLDGSAPEKIYADATLNGSNGLSAPRLIDLNGDGRVDVAYAGDLRGKLYKFDLASTTASEWRVAGGGAMFKALNDDGAEQPITTAPVYMVHPSGGLVVTFGTGRNVTLADRGDESVQSFYGLYDYGFELKTTGGYSAGGVTVSAAADMTKASWSPLPGTRGTSMVEQTFTSEWSTSSNTTKDENGDGQVDEDFANVIGTTKRGWYLDLPVERERVLRNPTWFDGELLSLYSDVPAVAAVSNDPCEAVETSAAVGYRTVVNGVTGNAPQNSSLFAETGGNREETKPGDVDTKTGDEGKTNCVGQDCETTDPRYVELGGRFFKVPSWRQMQ
ncbi:PilC/PilY family type IV pilus protein [Comamonas serinivorans]|nr:PilC/PilY family type IV pilus protein [Comamonas serinivorans]